jgi:hypothetical protein
MWCHLLINMIVIFRYYLLGQGKPTALLSANVNVLSANVNVLSAFCLISAPSLPAGNTLT